MANYLTRSNVAYDFSISPHKLMVVYEKNVIEYVFSSELYVNKFMEKSDENRKKINESLSHRFKFKIVNDLLCDLKLYTMIEKRGFLLYVNGDKIECLNDITLNGGILTYKTSEEQ